MPEEGLKVYRFAAVFPEQLLTEAGRHRDAVVPTDQRAVMRCLGDDLAVLVHDVSHSRIALSGSTSAIQRLTRRLHACSYTVWVCENHPDQPWEGPHTCTCGAVGAPCPRFARMWFHYLRGTHATQLMDRGVPVHQVAARIGDDPAVLLRVYAKLTRKPSDAMADAVNALATSFLKN
jgi:hypothetical protein